MKKNILVVDDSALMRRVISDIINSDERYTVVKTAADGQEGLALIACNPSKYDAIILDINMPKMNGLELLEQLQKHHIKAKIIVVSTVAKEGAKETIIALERGAFDFVTKPDNFIQVKGDDFKKNLMSVLSVATGTEDAAYGKSVLGSTVKSYKAPTTSSGGVSKEKISTDRVLTMYKSRLQQTEEKGTQKDVVKSGVSSSDTIQTVGISKQKQNYTPHKKLVGSKEGKRKLIAMASSTGGPRSLQSVIPLLPENLDAPVILVQHMPKGFTHSLAIRLDEMSKVHVKEAEDGEILKKGWVYIAPGGQHMKILKTGMDSKISLTLDPPIGGLRPCANIMYESLIGSVYDEITCVVLTGMGADGTDGIGALGEIVNVHVIAQDEESSVVYGMPKAVAAAGLVDEVKPLDQVASAIIKNVGVLNNGR